jgi:hypothetical protein
MRIIKHIIIAALATLPVASFAERSFGTRAFAIYEHAGDRITLDGVSTRYGIGAAGIEVSKQITPEALTLIRYGVGYHPSYSLKSFGTEFTGPVTGTLLELGLELDISKDLIAGSAIEFRFSDRHVFSNKMTGDRNGRHYTTSTDATMTSTEIRFSKEFAMNANSKLKLFAGINNWSLKALGTAYSSSFTVQKRVTGANQDFVSGFSYDTQVFGKLTTLGLTYRQLRADNTVDTLELSTTIEF